MARSVVAAVTGFFGFVFLIGGVIRYTQADQESPCTSAAKRCFTKVESSHYLLMPFRFGEFKGYNSILYNCRIAEYNLKKMKQYLARVCLDGMKDKHKVDRCEKSMEFLNMTACDPETACRIEMDYSERFIREAATLHKLDEFAGMQKMCPIYNKTLKYALKYLTESCQSLQSIIGRLDVLRNYTKNCSHYFDDKCFAWAVDCMQYVYDYQEFGKDEPNFSGTRRLSYLCLSHKKTSQCLMGLKKMCLGFQRVTKLLHAVTRNSSECLALDLRCRQEASDCYDRFLGLGSQSTYSITSESKSLTSGADPESNQHMCQRYERSTLCLGTLGMECIAEEPITNMYAYIRHLAEGCPHSSLQDLAHRACSQSPTHCVSAMTSAITICSVVNNAFQCVLEDQFSKGCITPSDVNFIQIFRLMSDFCAVLNYFPSAYQNCSALTKCLMMSEEFDVIGDDGLISEELLSSGMTDPALVCTYLKTTAGCYIEQAETCGYTAQFVEFMDSKHQKLRFYCPDHDPDHDGKVKGGTTRIVPTVVYYAIVIMVVMP